ncbi:hypothetical protein [Plantactinospora sp. CA-290183]|uniref:hypothetical protein n=1 Tax=Plantactinospora sp. CA-290183 TaxID=3240006 RepID=UPI003D91C173
MSEANPHPQQPVATVEPILTTTRDRFFPEHPMPAPWLAKTSLQSALAEKPAEFLWPAAALWEGIQRHRALPGEAKTGTIGPAEPTSGGTPPPPYAEPWAR